MVWLQYEKFGAQVFYNKFEGYGTQKQFAAAKTGNNWVLSLMQMKY
jgi:hypothetical protein